MTLTILLFDVDGVLIASHGYKEALRATVDVIAAQMGQPPIQLTDDEIAVFESVTLTNEWDSAALCAALLLLDALAVRPDLARDSLEATLAALRAEGASVPRPDFAAAARDLMGDQADHVLPSVRFLAALTARADPAAHPSLRELLSNVYFYRSPATFIFQHHTLGSERFARTYGEAPVMDVKSHLLEYDQPLIAPETAAHLLERTAQPGCRMALLTARPSLPPSDLAEPDSNHRHLYPPEGDLALDLLGWQGKAPLIASGRLAWLATRRGRNVAGYVKPSPVHALAAIGAAYCGCESMALEAAADLVEDHRSSGPLADVAKLPLRVVVFEDATVGIRATHRAAEALREVGAEVAVEAVGVSPHAAKRESLARVADRLADDVNQALIAYPG